MFMSKIIPSKNHSLIKICKLILNKDSVITEDDVSSLKEIIQNLLNSGLSPSDIKNKYSINYSDFGMFIKTSLGLKLKSVQEAVQNYYISNGKSLTDKKRIYKKECQFLFDPYAIKEIPGYQILLDLGIYHPVNNPLGVCRDHMVSIEYGWRNNIPPNIISSPMNCQFINNLENIKKGSSSCINIDQLMDRINNTKFQSIPKTYIKISKSKSHKEKISITNSKYITVTNGIKNLRILKNSSIPDGFRRGMTRKNKMVVQPGLEPGNKIF